MTAFARGSDLIAKSLDVPGVRDARVYESEPGKVDLVVWTYPEYVYPGRDSEVILDEVRRQVSGMIPMGVLIKVIKGEDIPIQLKRAMIGLQGNAAVAMPILDWVTADDFAAGLLECEDQVFGRSGNCNCQLSWFWCAARCAQGSPRARRWLGVDLERSPESYWQDRHVCQALKSPAIEDIFVHDIFLEAAGYAPILKVLRMAYAGEGLILDRGVSGEWWELVGLRHQAQRRVILEAVWGGEEDESDSP